MSTEVLLLSRTVQVDRNFSVLHGNVHAPLHFVIIVTQSNRFAVIHLEEKD